MRDNISIKLLMPSLLIFLYLSCMKATAANFDSTIDESIHSRKFHNEKYLNKSKRPLFNRHIEKYNDQLDLQQKFYWNSIIGNTQQVTKLLELGAKINMQGIDGNTAMHLSAIGCNVDVAKVFIEAGADIEMASNSGDTALHYAVQNKCVKYIKLLHSKAAKHDIKNLKGKTALDLAKEAGYDEISKIFNS